MSAARPAPETQATYPKGGSFLIEMVSPQEVFTPEDFNDEQRMIAKTTADFVNNEVLPNMEKLEEQYKTGDFSLTVSLLRKAADIGLLAGDIPAKYGGLELDKVCQMLVSEFISRSGGFSVSLGGHTGIGTWPITYFGTPEQKAYYLPKLGTGEWLAAYALSEPGSGSDALGARARAVLNAEGTHYILNGTKMWISNAGFADIFIVFCKVDGEKFSAFIVHRDYPGVSTGKEENKMGIHSSSTRQLILENVPVPKENLLGEIGKGHLIAFNCLNLGRYKLGGGVVGGAKSILEHTAKYVMERKQFDRPIGSFGAIKHKIGEMVARIYATESMSYRTAGLIHNILAEVDADDADRILKGIEEYAIECSIMKVYGSEMLGYVADEAVQSFGGYGYSEEYPVARAYRDARINRIFEGTNEINRLLIPGMLLKRSMRGELPILQATQRILDELLAGPSFEEEDDAPLSKERKAIVDAKKIALLIAGIAVQKYGQKLTEEQEVLIAFSDIAMDVFAMESSYLRALKLHQSRPAEAATRDALAATQVFINDAVGRIELTARRILPTLSEGDNLRIQLAAVKRFSKYDLVDTVRLRRYLADRACEVQGYPVFAI
ncbi:acyl-CoA dehydrogenase family protein [Chloracidobacterium aggregatum]|jgi:alkylation response protein AidB-like acyl-CoA dehydrogenase|nr:acyl-CoA dehydrogenase family protein [Chloracidobacterium aggregatum]